ncbi:phasin family protein [uncultured Albimonas sp.]|uniref:phasin family protein n=1 Tax=uncultured Albimonas sp. TaxID=1331701 RepID=UPI0030EE6F30|tara:strand:+ start:1388 stop:1822 length:435 start_codon:yes stop_codon:yes gene_type:complete
MNAMSDTTAQFETFAAEAQAKMTESMEKMAKSFEDMSAFGQASLDAFMKSANIAMKSAEEMSSESLAFSKKSMEESVAAAKDFAASKSVMELMEKQSDFSKTFFDGYMKQASKMNEMAMAASKDAMEPLAARVSAAADMAKTSA